MYLRYVRPAANRGKCEGTCGEGLLGQGFSRVVSNSLSGSLHAASLGQPAARFPVIELLEISLRLVTNSNDPRMSDRGGKTQIKMCS